MAGTREKASGGPTAMIPRAWRLLRTRARGAPFSELSYGSELTRMSVDPALTVSDPTAAPETEPPVAAPAKSFLRHAKLIGALTLLSRIVGLVREMVAAHFLGAGVVASAFTVAFTIPNLFRKLLGEGALSAAFIPLYAQAHKRGTTETGEPAAEFAAASVNLLFGILLGITVVGEAILLALIFNTSDQRPDRVLMLKFAAV